MKFCKIYSMRRVSTGLFGILLILLFSSCDKVKEAKDAFVKKGVQLLKKTETKKLVCPAKMVKVDNFCIDIYEFPNLVINSFSSVSCK